MFTRLCFIAMFGLSTSSVFCQADDDRPLPTVVELDLEAYMGKWYQVAAIPAWFQRKCVKDTSATYERLADGRIKVTNRCLQADGSENVAAGLARLNANFSEPSKLEVTFAKLFNNWLWIFAGDYWIIDLAADYTYAVVGEPNRQYLWILSRHKAMSRDSLMSLETRIRDKHYDTCKILITQEGELTAQPLCSLSQREARGGS